MERSKMEQDSEGKSFEDGTYDVEGKEREVEESPRKSSFWERERDKSSPENIDRYFETKNKLSLGSYEGDLSSSRIDDEKI